ncbi:MAG: TOBE domain-containing protein, partial [Comamonadaceae bacterium]
RDPQRAERHGAIGIGGGREQHRLAHEAGHEGGGGRLVQLLRITPRQAVRAGAVQVAVRPEAWQLVPAGEGLAARLAKLAYLGSNYEYTFDTALGAIFVVSPDVGRALAPGAELGLRLAGHGVSVVQAP